MSNKSIDIDEQAKKITKLMASRLAEKIKSVRKKKEITTRQLKELANVSTAIISDFETKNNYLPKMEVLVKFAIALDIDIKDMLSTMLPPDNALDFCKSESKATLEDILKTEFIYLENEDIKEVIKFANTKNNIKFVDKFGNSFEDCILSTDENNNLVAIKDGEVIFKASKFVVKKSQNKDEDSQI